MSTPSDASAPLSSTNHSSFSLLSIVSKVTFDGTNYYDWMRNINMDFRFEGKVYVLEVKLVEIDEATATPEQLSSYKKHYDGATKVTCIMVSIMIPELTRF